MFFNASRPCRRQAPVHPALDWSLMVGSPASHIEYAVSRTQLSYELVRAECPATFPAGHRPQRGGCNGKALFAQIRAQGYRGVYWFLPHEPLPRTSRRPRPPRVLNLLPAFRAGPSPETLPLPAGLNCPRAEAPRGPHWGTKGDEPEQRSLETPCCPLGHRVRRC